MFEEHLHEIAGKVELVGTKAQLRELENRIDQVGVVIEVRVQMRAAVLVGRKQPAVAPQSIANEIEGARGGECEILAPEGARRDREVADHERIPGGQYL